MTYKVVTSFFDKEDNKRLYEVGQTYPRTGFKPSDERIKLLSTVKNEQKTIFIKEAVKRNKSEAKKNGK